MINRTNYHNLLYIIILLFVPLSNYATTARYRLSWRDNPATSMVIGWDQISGEYPVVQYYEDNPTNKKKKVEFHFPDRTVKYMEMNNKFSRLTGLKPDTLYHFRIKDSEGVSPSMLFRTAPNKYQPLAFIAGGDSRGNRQVRRNGNLLVSKIRPLFVIFGGDYVGTVIPQLWKNWLDDWQNTRSKDGRMYPIIPTHGNHEKKDLDVINKIFDIKNSSTYFSLNICGNFMRIYGLNSELQYIDKEEWKKQNKWFKNELKNNTNATWQIVAYHRPFHPHTENKSEMNGSIKAWADLFYKYGVNLAIESDSHTVKRTYPIKPDHGPNNFEDFIRDDKNGTTFIGEGTWGAPLRPANDDKPWTMASDSFHQFKLIHAFKDHMDIRSVRFENAKEVTANTEDTRHNIPTNLDIWEPESGAVLRITPHKNN